MKTYSEQQSSLAAEIAADPQEPTSAPHDQSKPADEQSDDQRLSTDSKRLDKPDLFAHEKEIPPTPPNSPEEHTSPIVFTKKNFNKLGRTQIDMDWETYEKYLNEKKNKVESANVAEVAKPKKRRTLPTKRTIVKKAKHNNK